MIRKLSSYSAQNEWSGRPESRALGAGAVGVGGYGWLRWPVAGLRCMPSARLRCARALWAVAGRPPGEGRRRRRRSACRGRDDRHGLASRDGLPLTESVPRAAAAARPTAGRFQRILGKVFGARRRARHANPPSADGERQSLYFAHAMCTDRDLVAGVARAQLPYAANMVSGVDTAGCARGAGPGTAEAAARLTGMRCEGRGNFD